MNMEILHKAILLNNNILRKAILLNNNTLEQKWREVQVISNIDSTGILYYIPLSIADIYNTLFREACVIIYEAITKKNNITSKDMIKLNKAYRILKSEYDI
jgi:hypothetical protein